mmetsp:Transcript_32815/g.50107  ORF Transcript_32815/g.50107 Transcript_32815/m.50107 type:complete len:205 (+) Transcript_32815:905-1519(+)
MMDFIMAESRASFLSLSILSTTSTVVSLCWPRGTNSSSLMELAILASGWCSGLSTSQMVSILEIRSSTSWLQRKVGELGSDSPSSELSPSLFWASIITSSSSLTSVEASFFCSFFFWISMKLVITWIRVCRLDSLLCFWLSLRRAVEYSTSLTKLSFWQRTEKNSFFSTRSLKMAEALRLSSSVLSGPSFSTSLFTAMACLALI